LVEDKSKKGETLMKNIMSFLFGVVVGAAVALLYAPSTGEEMRSNIKTQVDTQYVKLQDEWQKGLQEMQARLDMMSSDLQALASKSKDSDESA
jgi:gas vesicle protein